MTVKHYRLNKHLILSPFFILGILFPHLVFPLQIITPFTIYPFAVSYLPRFILAFTVSISFAVGNSDCVFYDYDTFRIFHLYDCNIINGK